jgi:hypothetical protein
LEGHEKLFFIVIVSLISLGVAMVGLDAVVKESFEIQGEIVDIQYVGNYFQTRTIVRLRGGEVITYPGIMEGVEIGKTYVFHYAIDGLNQEKLKSWEEG